MKFVNFGQELNFLVIILSLGVQLSMIASALVPAVESAGVAASRAWQAAGRIPSRVPQRGYSTTPTARVEQTPETTVRVEPRAAAARYATARSMSAGRPIMGYGAQAGRSMGMMPGRRAFSSQVAETSNKLTRADVEKMISSSKGWFAKLTGNIRLNLKGKNLSDADLSNLDLTEADLTDANLSHANLRHTKLYKAILYNADLSYSNLERAILSEANLSYANLSYANLRTVIVSRTNFSHANLYKADLSQVNTGLNLTQDLSNNFHKAKLSYSNLNNAHLEKSDFTYADLSHSSVEWAFLSGSNFQFADLSNTNLNGSFIQNSDLTDANFTDAKLTDGKRFYADFTGSINANWSQQQQEQLRDAQENEKKWERLERKRRQEQRAGEARADREEDARFRSGGKGFYEDTYSSDRSYSQEQQQPPSRSSSSMTELDARMLLGVKANATPKEIKAAYRTAAMKWHPDTVSEENRPMSDEMMKKVNEAFEVLSVPQ